jgi:hypothetical protein
VALRVQAERLIAAYVAPGSNRNAIINELIALFDGPGQREAQMLEAQGEGKYKGRKPTARAKTADIHRLSAEGRTRDAIATRIRRRRL